MDSQLRSLQSEARPISFETPTPPILKVSASKSSDINTEKILNILENLPNREESPESLKGRGNIISTDKYTIPRMVDHAEFSLKVPDQIMALSEVFLSKLALGEKLSTLKFIRPTEYGKHKIVETHEEMSKYINHISQLFIKLR